MGAANTRAAPDWFMVLIFFISFPRRRRIQKILLLIRSCAAQKLILGSKCSCQAYRPNSIEIREYQRRLRDVEDYVFSSGIYSIKFPGEQSRALQMASKVEKRIARALLVLRTERLLTAIPVIADNSFNFIRLSKRT